MKWWQKLFRKNKLPEVCPWCKNFLDVTVSYCKDNNKIIRCGKCYLPVGERE